MYQMMQFQQERIFGMATALKGMEAVINETIEYTRDRKVFGKSVLDNQYIHFRLAELSTEVEMLRSLLHRRWILKFFILLSEIDSTYRLRVLLKHIP